MEENASEKSNSTPQQIVPWPMRIFYSTALVMATVATKWLAPKANAKSVSEEGDIGSQFVKAFTAAGFTIALFIVCFVVSLFVLVGLLAGLVVLLIAVWPTQVLVVTSHPAFVIPAILIGVMLYSLRSIHLRIYAVIEIVISVTAIWLAVATTSESLLVKGLGLMTGIYILVRGLDNFEKTIPKEGLLRDRWDTWLHGRDV
jgi:hypothetical protein